MLIGFLHLAIVLGVIGVLLTLAVIFLAGQMILRPPRTTDARAVLILKRLSPEDLGLKYTDEHFGVHDARTGRPLHIAGWWIPSSAAQGRCIVLVHGYSDAKVGAIAWAPMLHALGWNILAVDLRAHGESGGRHCTAGYYERHDLDQVVNEIRARRPAETGRVVLLGISLGAAVCAAAAASRDDLAGVVLEGPFADFRRAVVAHADLFGMPGLFIPRAGAVVAQLLSGADFGAVRPTDMIPKIACPVLVIHAGDDPLMDDVAATQLEQAIRSRADFGQRSFFWAIPDAGHVLGLAANPRDYQQRLAAFLELDSPSEGPPPLSPTP